MGVVDKVEEDSGGEVSEGEDVQETGGESGKVSGELRDKTGEKERVEKMMMMMRMISSSSGRMTSNPSKDSRRRRRTRGSFPSRSSEWRRVGCYQAFIESVSTYMLSEWMRRRRYSHLASVDAVVGDLEVGGRPGLFVVEPVSEHDDLYGVGQECHDKGLQSGRDVRVISFAEQCEWSSKREKKKRLTAGMARMERFRSKRPDRRPRAVAELDILSVEEVDRVMGLNVSSESVCDCM